MQFITTVTQKGQVTIPKDLRDELNIKIYSRVKVEREHNKLMIKPVEDLLDLAGAFIPKKKRSVLEARKAMERSYKRP